MRAFVTIQFSFVYETDAVNPSLSLRFGFTIPADDFPPVRDSPPPLVARIYSTPAAETRGT